LFTKCVGCIVVCGDRHSCSSECARLYIRLGNQTTILLGYTPHNTQETRFHLLLWLCIFRSIKCYFTW